MTDHFEFLKPLSKLMTSSGSIVAGAMNYCIPMGFASISPIGIALSCVAMIGSTGLTYYFIIPQMKKMVIQTFVATNNVIINKLDQTKQWTNTKMNKIKLFLSKLWINHKHNLLNLLFIFISIIAFVIGIFIAIETFQSILPFDRHSFVDSQRYKMVVLQQSLIYVWHLLKIIASSEYYKLKQCAFGVFVTIPIVRYFTTPAAESLATFKKVGNICKFLPVALMTLFQFVTTIILHI